MSDEEAPTPYEAVGVSPLNVEYCLDAYLNEGEVILGFAGTIKYLDGDGDVCTLHVFNGVGPHEAVGMFEVAKQYVIDEIRDY